MGWEQGEKYSWIKLRVASTQRWILGKVVTVSLGCGSTLLGNGRCNRNLPKLNAENPLLRQSPVRYQDSSIELKLCSPGTLTKLSC